MMLLLNPPQRLPLLASAVLALTFVAAAPTALAAGAEKPSAAQQPALTKHTAWTRLPQKPNGSGVRVAYRLEGTPQVGKPLTITLQFNHVTHAGGAAASFTADSGLTLQTPDSLARLAQKQTTQQQVVVTPQAEGLFYVNVFTEQGGRKSAASIPVQVGTKRPVMKPLGPVTTDASGERVINMPAK